MKRGLVVLVLLVAAGCSSGKATPTPTPTANLAAMRAAMPTLTSAQFQQLVSLGQKMCVADHAGLSVFEATLADQHTTDVGQQIVHFMCPNREHEYTDLVAS